MIEKQSSGRYAATIGGGVSGGSALRACPVVMDSAARCAAGTANRGSAAGNNIGGSTVDAITPWLPQVARVTAGLRPVVLGWSSAWPAGAPWHFMCAVALDAPWRPCSCIGQLRGQISHVLRSALHVGAPTSARTSVRTKPTERHRADASIHA
jgi:hypothetical protein